MLQWQPELGWQQYLNETSLKKFKVVISEELLVFLQNVFLSDCKVAL
jgi:hypothetical protein